ncbi:hypothetical protein [Deefgea rivuli]|uniref:hypothetical protein n=1 Tax=Deefgea rivuli TaxID=400948 RepID=UPI00048361A1|nr:hypothetical protein [Deefgea rivuli]
MKFKALFFSAFLSLPTFAADDTSAPNDWGAAARLSTLGLGLDIAYAINPNWNARFNINTIEINKDEISNGAHWDSTSKMLTAGLLADYHPFDNGFKVTAGAYYNDNHGDGTAQPVDGTIKIGKNYYKANQVSNSHATGSLNNKFSPYLGVGYGYSASKDPARSGLSFTADLGVMYQGSANVTYSATCLDASVCGQLQSDVTHEAQRIADDHKNFYPVVSIGVGYRF